MKQKTHPLALPQIVINPAPVRLDDMPKTYMSPFELAVLVDLVQSTDSRSMMEIGCNSGRTAAVILRECPKLGHYLGVDVLPGYAFHCKVQAKEVPAQPGYLAAKDPRFTLWLSKAGSRDISPKSEKEYDVVFIDGDHSEAAVKADTDLARSIVRPGGMIIWHDYHGLETVDVRRVLDAQYVQGHKIQHVAGTWLAFERV